jgi:hypothetical protein
MTHRDRWDGTATAELPYHIACLPRGTDQRSHDASAQHSGSLGVLRVTTLVSSQLVARDDGRFANSPLKPWFDRLASGKGLCCSFADGATVQDVDWDTQDGRYRVRIYGQWIVVPDAAVVTEPNRFGPAVVWPYNDRYGNTQIRCFMPGAGT